MYATQGERKLGRRGWYAAVTTEATANTTFYKTYYLLLVQNVRVYRLSLSVHPSYILFIDIIYFIYYSHIVWSVFTQDSC